MTVELNGRIAKRTAHFATPEADAPVYRRVAAGQADLASIKDQVAALRREKRPQDERRGRSGSVKSEFVTLRKELYSTSDSLSSIDRSPSSEDHDRPEWPTGSRMLTIRSARAATRLSKHTVLPTWPGRCDDENAF